MKDGQLKAEFDSLVKHWREDTRILSDATLILEHPAYQEIISIGELRTAWLGWFDQNRLVIQGRSSR